MGVICMMGPVMRSFTCFLIFLLLAGSAGLTAAEERRVIENHSFGIFTTEGGGVVVSLQNDNCVGHYRVASGKTVISEGQIDFRLLPVTNIPFGGNDLQVACIAGNRLGVVIR
jgi:hypothetical protein